MKSKGFRTLAINSAALILPILDSTDVTHLLSGKSALAYGILLGIANIILRVFTDTPIGQSTNIPVVEASIPLPAAANAFLSVFESIVTNVKALQSVNAPVVSIPTQAAAPAPFAPVEK